MGSRNLHRYSIFVACCTFVLIIAGGLVTSTQSGLSVPDWPTTYGHFMFAFPLESMVGGIFFEHSHRMIASIVGFLTIILAIWLWKVEKERRWLRNLGFVALGAVIAQGILGGLTVLYLLPTPISVGHATLAQTFFAIMVSIALFTSTWWQSEQRLISRVEGKSSIVLLSILTTCAIYIQLILGALLRHTESGLVVPDFPLAYGQILPSITPKALERYTQILIQSDIRLAADGMITSGQIIIHMAHRFWAFVTAGMILWTSLRLVRPGAQSIRLRRLGIIFIVMVIMQVTLGAFTVLSRKAVDITTAHVVLGALTLVTCVLITLHTVKLFGLRARTHPSPAPFAPREVPA